MKKKFEKKGTHSWITQLLLNRQNHTQRHISLGHFRRLENYLFLLNFLLCTVRIKLLFGKRQHLNIQPNIRKT